MRCAAPGRTRSGEVGSASRVSELDDTASVHEACAADIVADIRSGATVPGRDAAVSQSTVSPPQPPPGVKLGLLGGADRLPQPAAWESDLLAGYLRLRELQNRYKYLSRTAIVLDFEQAAVRITCRLLDVFRTFDGNAGGLAFRSASRTAAERAYRALQEIALQAAAEGDDAKTIAIRECRGGNQRAGRRGIAGAMHATRHRRPTTGPHHHSIPLDPSLQSVALPAPSLLAH